MNAAICYSSQHHGNTLRVLEVLASRYDIDLIDVTSRIAPHLEQYDAVGFASGIYYSAFHPTVQHYADQYLPAGKDCFLIYTYGMKRKGYTGSMRKILQPKGCRILGEFGCRGLDTFGPFRLVGGIAKGHRNEEDFGNALAFYHDLEEMKQ